MNIKVRVEIGTRENTWSTCDVGEANVEFNWPEGAPIPNLYAMVEGLAIEAFRLHMEEVAKSKEE